MQSTYFVVDTLLSIRTRKASYLHGGSITTDNLASGTKRTFALQLKFGGHRLKHQSIQFRLKEASTTLSARHLKVKSTVGAVMTSLSVELEIFLTRLKLIKKQNRQHKKLLKLNKQLKSKHK